MEKSDKSEALRGVDAVFFDLHNTLLHGNESENFNSEKLEEIDEAINAYTKAYHENDFDTFLDIWEYMYDLISSMLESHPKSKRLSKAKSQIDTIQASVEMYVQRQKNNSTSQLLDVFSETFSEN